MNWILEEYLLADQYIWDLPSNRHRLAPTALRFAQAGLNQVTQIAERMSSTSNITETQLQAAAARVVERCDALGQISDVPGELTRTFCSPAMKKAHDRVESWFKSANLTSRLDEVGNLIGCAGEPESEKPILMIGSHLDTVINAGRFDGTLGVLLGLGVAEVLAEIQYDLPFDIHIIAFSEEEGARYKFPFIGSLGLTGMLNSEDLERCDDDGITMRQALAEFGCDAANYANANYASAAYAGRSIIGFIESHLEQSTALEEAKLPVGVVSSIIGQTRAVVEFVGNAGHAGTVEHECRKDALAAAAEFVLAVEKLGCETEGLFATTGRIEVHPGLSNVICGRAELSVELRHEHNLARERAFEALSRTIEKIANQRGIEAALLEFVHAPAVQMDAPLTQHLTTAIRGIGFDTMQLVSAAGHDAMIMSKLAPSCMLFVRSKDGVSHHPSEFVSPEDIQTALRVLVDAVLALAENIRQRT